MTYNTILETIVNQGTKQKSDIETEANNSTSVPVKKAKTNEEPAKSTSVTHQKPAAQCQKPAALRQQPAPAATPSNKKYISKGLKKHQNPADDKDTAPDDPITPVPPLKKPRGKNDIAHKPQPVHRTGIAL